jgi:hypothetical protein
LLTFLVKGQADNYTADRSTGEANPYHCQNCQRDPDVVLSMAGAELYRNSVRIEQGWTFILLLTTRHDL